MGYIASLYNSGAGALHVRRAATWLLPRRRRTEGAAASQSPLRTALGSTRVEHQAGQYTVRAWVHTHSDGARGLPPRHWRRQAAAWSVRRRPRRHRSKHHCHQRVQGGDDASLPDERSRAPHLLHRTRGSLATRRDHRLSGSICHQAAGARWDVRLQCSPRPHGATSAPEQGELDAAGGRAPLPQRGGEPALLSHTRPDISFAVGYVSRFLESPTTEHMSAVKHLLGYIARTIHYGCRFTNKGGCTLVGYSDADLAGDVDDRKSTSGFVFFLGSSPVSWPSQKQKVVACPPAKLSTSPAPPPPAKASS